MYQVAGFGRGSTWIEDLERVSVDWEREIISHCKSILNLEINSLESFMRSPFLVTVVSVK